MSEKLTFEAEVTGIQKTYYNVSLLESEFSDREIRATLSGKMRMNKIRVIVGDIVTIELNEYDPTKARIIYRKK